MIVKMKKVSLAVMEAEHQQALKKLRDAGMMHIIKDTDAYSSSEEIAFNLNLLETALLILESHKKKVPKKQKGIDIQETFEKALEIIGLGDQEEQAKQKLTQYRQDIKRLEPWGDFDPMDVRILAGKGIDLRLVEAKNSQYDALIKDPECEVIKICQQKKTTLCVVIYRNVPQDGGHVGIPLPDYGINDLQQLVVKTNKEIVGIHKQIGSMAMYYPALKKALSLVQQKIDFENVRNNLAGDGGVVGLTGFVPVDKIDELQNLSANSCWAMAISDPEPQDTVPTQVRNPAPIGIIRPVFKMMGIYPGYNEPDISFWFLTFLSIFVAMILGDAAYGAIILLLVAIIRIKTGKPSDFLKLLTLFGLTTFAWGCVTGTWFASLSLVRDTPLKDYIVPAVATYQNELFPGYTVEMGVFPGNQLDSTLMVMWISLLLGIIMVVLARIQNFIRMLPSPAALAQLGWLSIVIAMYWLIMNIVLQLNPLPQIMNLVKPMLFGGFGMVFVFGGQGKGVSFFKGILQGLKDLLPNLLNAIGAFGDIISFIRLFAVGLVGVALSQSFNAMAPRGGGIAIIGAALVLGIGHGLNLVLNALSVLVHGVRLNVLEFSGHMDMEWAGIGFDPFRLHVHDVELPEIVKE